MKYFYKPKTNLEQFGFIIYKLLVDNFPQTFYVGGMVRDLLLGKTITDIDIATQAKPHDVIQMLNKAGINYESKHKQFGVIVAKKARFNIEIATFRKDSYGNSRYPKISFVKTAKQDSSRRDFTINALYLSPKDGAILDFHLGLNDLKIKKIKFIGSPKKRIAQDPLRIIRALRFSRTLDFKLDDTAKKAIKKNANLVQILTTSRVINELKKIRKSNHKNFVIKQLQEKFLLDIKNF